MSIEELFGTLQQSIIAEWRKHLKTSRYSKHMALDEFYKEMPELVDTLIEDYNGHMGKKVENFKNILDAEKLDALQYLEELHKICQDGYALLPKDAPELKSDLDAIKSMIDSVMYKVRELKETHHMKSLAEYLNESLLCESVNIKKLMDQYNIIPNAKNKRKFKAAVDAWVDEFGDKFEIEFSFADDASMVKEYPDAFVETPSGDQCMTFTNLKNPAESYKWTGEEFE